MKQLIRPLLPVAYRLAVVYWFLFRPHGYGSFVAVWCDDHVLLIKNSYKSPWTFPSGGKKGQETPRQTAVRELMEEVGIEVDGSQLKLTKQFLSRSQYKHDHATAFEIEIANEPAIQVDNFEVIEAKFVKFTDLCAGAYPLTNVVKLYLEWKLAQLEHASR